MNSDAIVRKSESSWQNEENKLAPKNDHTSWRKCREMEVRQGEETTHSHKREKEKKKKKKKLYHQQPHAKQQQQNCPKIRIEKTKEKKKTCKPIQSMCRRDSQ